MVTRRKLKRKITRGIRKFETTVATAIAASFAFVMALAWHDAIKSAVDEFLSIFGVVGTGYLYKIYAAIIVTIVASISIWLVARWQK